MVSTRNQHSPWLVSCIGELLLALRKLGVGSWGVNDLWQFDAGVANQPLSLCLKPRESWTQETESLTCACRRLEQSILTFFQCFNHSVHEVVLAVIRFERKVNVSAVYSLFALFLQKVIGLHLNLYLDFLVILDIILPSSIFSEFRISRFEVWHFTIVFYHKIWVRLIQSVLDRVMILLVLNIDVLFVFLPVLRLFFGYDNLLVNANIIWEVISNITCILELLAHWLKLECIVEPLVEWSVTILLIHFLNKN